LGLKQLREATFRRFVRLREGKQRLLSQPKELNEKRASAIRKLITVAFGYAESGLTFDPEGKYLCGTCDQRAISRTNRSQCATVSGLVSLKAGGCFHYVKGPALGTKLVFLGKASQTEAGYGERPRSKGFGCSRCQYSQKAVQRDSKGRPSWCGYWGVHVQPAACCYKESGPDLIEAPGDKHGG